MHDDTTTTTTTSGFSYVPGEHPPHELGCIVVAIYAGAAGAGLVTLATMSILLRWWQGLIVIAVILGLSAVLWALIRFGAH